MAHALDKNSKSESPADRHTGPGPAIQNELRHSPDKVVIFSALVPILVSRIERRSHGDPASETDRSALRFDFDRRRMLGFRGSAITSMADCGLIAGWMTCLL
jgi:hypothetical protein